MNDTTISLLSASASSYLLLLLLVCLFSAIVGNRHNSNTKKEKFSEGNGIIFNVNQLMQDDKFYPSVSSWNKINEKSKISIVTMVVDHNGDGPWYIPSLHEKYSIGWNRTTEKPYLLHPTACNVRFFGIGLESTFAGFQYGGTGYLTIEFKNNAGKTSWHGFDKNETNRVHCYYMTNKHLGSEFIDTPKTLGIAIHCPIDFTSEVGPFNFNTVMLPGYYCRVLADTVTVSTINLRPTSYAEDTQSSVKDEIQGEVTTIPSGLRLQEIKELTHTDYRPHAVCTVQTFRNDQTGIMLHAFVDYYYRLGWYVIIYDRFGFHKQYVEDFIGLPGVDYHPYTVFQLTQPSKYNSEYAAKQSSTFKYFYKMEKNWGYSGSGQADTADQDADKTRTYDYARLEYIHLDLILYIDTDEFFYCPQASKSISAQRHYQHHTLGTFSSLGIEEMRFVRIPYSGIAPVGFINTPENRSSTDFTYSTLDCMMKAYFNTTSPGAPGDHNINNFFQCWSSASSYDNFPKSGDYAGKCPFHYNHWSCDGMRNGGRDWGDKTPRCRCKVAFDMINGFEYKPMLKRCHILHFNDNKYRFQSSRSKRAHDFGSIDEYCPLVSLFGNQEDGIGTSKYRHSHLN